MPAAGCCCSYPKQLKSELDSSVAPAILRGKFGSILPLPGAPSVNGRAPRNSPPVLLEGPTPGSSAGTVEARDRPATGALDMWSPPTCWQNGDDEPADARLGELKGDPLVIVWPLFIVSASADTGSGADDRVEILSARNSTRSGGADGSFKFGTRSSTCCCRFWLIQLDVVAVELMLRCVDSVPRDSLCAMPSGEGLGIVIDDGSQPEGTIMSSSEHRILSSADNESFRCSGEGELTGEGSSAVFPDAPSKPAVFLRR